MVAEIRVVTAWVGTGAQNTDKLPRKSREEPQIACVERAREIEDSKGAPSVGGQVLSPEERCCFLPRRDVGEWQVLKKNESSNLEMDPKWYLQSPWFGTESWHGTVAHDDADSDESMSCSEQVLHLPPSLSVERLQLTDPATWTPSTCYPIETKRIWVWFGKEWVSRNEVRIESRTLSSPVFYLSTKHSAWMWELWANWMLLTAAKMVKKRAYKNRRPSRVSVFSARGRVRTWVFSSTPEGTATILIIGQI